MRQVIYISTATAVAATMQAREILQQSRRNNAREGITGLLYADGKRFMQVLEGDEAAVARALAKIARDPRHHAIVILCDKTIDHREFGDWSMAWREPGVDASAFVGRVAECVAHASPSVRATFSSFAEVRRAA